jgi:hypothetical protein
VVGGIAVLGGLIAGGLWIDHTIMRDWRAHEAERGLVGGCETRLMILYHGLAAITGHGKSPIPPRDQFARGGVAWKRIADATGYDVGCPSAKGIDNGYMINPRVCGVPLREVPYGTWVFADSEPRHRGTYCRVDAGGRISRVARLE